MAARLLRPISSMEFASMMQSVKPPSGWSETLAVANSGGPDSTCLTFLLNRYLKDRPVKLSSKGTPQRLVSLTVDHDLQSGSAEMANLAARIAESLGVLHITKKLPWGEGKYPPKPEPGKKIEELARDLRYAVFMENMIDLKADVLVLGHHCDDQVETMLMRLGRGSGQFGLAGMRPCRRLGMGDRKQGDANQQFGIEEMKRWIVRPLLTVGKDRILATCEEHKLDYVNDPTNFQPQLTIRNAIRHVTGKGGAAGLTAEDPCFAEFPAPIAKQLARINVAGANEPSNSLSLASDLEHLRTVSKGLTSALLDIDDKVDKFIAKHRLPSPPGTFMMSPLSLEEIDSPLILEALVLRIARYISPEPWGSPRSELGRRKSSIDRLVKHLRDYQRYRSRNNNSICVGSSVWWRLVTIGRNQMRTTVRAKPVKDISWIAVRQPGHRLADAAEVPLHPLRLNVTQKIRERREAWLARKAPKTLEVLFDCRFLIRFHVDKIPADILESISTRGKIEIKPRESWIFPQVMHVVNKEPTLIHNNIVHQPFFLEKEWGTKLRHDINADWIDMEYFRPLSAI
ncbi:hypothetical protein GALMADRAFT_228003 [Galerina marginata CBS 339.88]|uniref:tRNA(Ile)-lysidine synthetase n=1 Tax=Galerina marginata (strain CBS 339.88) TaxID=685588 RepID=A0A067T0W1_GALM3|nr:hypothetical protein GALMADRAFT_228003 [Galerina marginata CBS 339.88]